MTLRTISSDRLVDGANLELLDSTWDGTLYLSDDGTYTAPPGSGGDVVGPASATDNAVVRFDGTTGKLVQNSAVTIADTTGDITAGKYNTVAISGASTPTLAVTGTATISGSNTGDQTNISGNAATVTVADAGGDTTTFPLLGTAATGSLSPATDAGLTYNATTNALSTTTFIGALTWNADTATLATATNALKSATTTVNVSSATAPTSGQVLTATSDSAATWQTPSAGTPTAITVANEASDTTCFPLFVTAATWDLWPKTKSTFGYNSSTGSLWVGTAAPASVNTRDMALEVSAAWVSAWALPGLVLRGGSNYSTNPAWELYMNAPGGTESWLKLSSGTNNILTARNDKSVVFDGVVTATNPSFLTRINTPEIKAEGSAWVDVHNNSWTQVALFGAGGGTWTSLVWVTNIGSASADYHQLAGGTGTITDTATGSSTDIDINLVPKGAGVLKSGGTAVLLNGWALGTPSSGTLTNCTWLPAAWVSGTALVAAAIGTTVQAYDADLTTWAGITPWANVGTFLATPSSANLAAAVTDETGSGALVFATSPTLVTPVLGTPTSGTLTNCTGYKESMIIAIWDETTAITTGTAKVTFRMPYAFTVTAVRASLTTASSSGTPTFDINEAWVSILSTKITIDANELTSTTAATAPVISDSALADDAEITIDIDTAGTWAKGAKIYLIWNR